MESFPGGRGEAGWQGSIIVLLANGVWVGCLADRVYRAAGRFSVFRVDLDRIVWRWVADPVVSNVDSQLYVSLVG